MFATFDQLAEFSDENKNADNNTSSTSTVDMSAIINRLNDLERKINGLITRTETVDARQDATEPTRTETTEPNESEENDNGD